MIKMTSQRYKHQRGDTIVEVMLAMVIIGMSLGLGYSISSNAFNIGRGAQERSEAVKAAESHVERLKVAYDNADDAGITALENPAPYCVLPDGTTVAVSAAPGNQCNGFLGSIYSIRIEYVNSTAPIKDYFRSVAVWDLAGSAEEGRVELLYRP